MTKGLLPIYFDDADRSIIDAIRADGKPHEELYPSNPPAQKLHHCLEAMRDLLPLLETLAGTEAADKRRRQLKLLFTPLCSLVESILRLMHDIQCNPDTKHSLPPGTDALVARMEKMLDAAVPHRRNQLLRQIRNRMSAHVDSQTDPMAARALFAQAQASDVGRWLDALMTVLADLLKLPIYVWSCSSKDGRVVGLTAFGAPVITFFECDDGGHVVRIAGMYLMKRDPRTEVFDLLRALIESSRWMFRPNDPQIQGFRRDGSTDSWAQSLMTLRELEHLPIRVRDGQPEVRPDDRRST